MQRRCYHATKSPWAAPRSCSRPTSRCKVARSAKQEQLRDRYACFIHNCPSRQVQGFSPMSVCLHFPFEPVLNHRCIGNISPYSSGASGASLTSTSVDPQASSKLLWDEVSHLLVKSSII